MNDVTKPNFMRYQRVAQLIEKEAALKERLGSKTETVLKPNGEKVEFPKEVVDLTERIHAAGMDANAINKQQIMGYAVAVILWGEDGGLPPVPARTDAPVAAPAASEAKKKAPAKVKRVKKPKVVEKKATATPEPVEKPAAPPPAAAPAAPKVTAPDAPGAVRQVTVSSPPAQCAGTNMPFVPGCAASSNLMAAAQLLEIHDKSPEGKDLLVRLNKIIDDLLKRIIIPTNVQRA